MKPRLEKYGNVQEHHVRIMEDHFSYVLDHFNQRYKLNGGIIGSPTHQLSQERAASFVAMKLLEESQRLKNLEITELSSNYEFDCPEFDCYICVKAETRNFNNEEEMVRHELLHSHHLN